MRARVHTLILHNGILHNGLCPPRSRKEMKNEALLSPRSPRSRPAPSFFLGPPHSPRVHGFALLSPFSSESRVYFPRATPANAGPLVLLSLVEILLPRTRIPVPKRNWIESAFGADGGGGAHSSGITKSPRAVRLSSGKLDGSRGTARLGSVVTKTLADLV